MKQLTRPGLYADVPHTDYVADPCVQPSLSSSIIKLLLERTPRHALEAHPRLNTSWEPKTSDKFSLGQAVHCFALEREPARFAIFHGDSWRTKEAKKLRNDALFNGQIPILDAQWDIVKAMELQRRIFCLDAFDGADPFMRRLGDPEVTLIWQEPPEIWCRARIDWLPNEGSRFFDYKTTGTSVNPLDLERHAFVLGYDIQATWYSRGLLKLQDREPPIRCTFLFQETNPPFACSLVEFSEEALVSAEARIQKALTLWHHCLQNDDWRGYAPKIATLQTPAFIEWRRQAEELLDADSV